MQCMGRRIYIYHRTLTNRCTYLLHSHIYSTHHITQYTVLIYCTNGAHVRTYTSTSHTHCTHLIALVSCTVLDIPCSRRTGKIFPRTTMALEAPGPVGSHALMVTLDSSLQAISAASRTLSCTRKCSKHNTASADMYTQSTYTYMLFTPTYIQMLAYIYCTHPH